MILQLDLLDGLCRMIHNRSGGQYTADVKFIQLPGENDQKRFSIRLAINDEIIFEETTVVSIENKLLVIPIQEIKQQLVIRLIKSIMETGVSKGIEWYQKKMEYEGPD